jgi:hypothetical protein
MQTGLNLKTMQRIEYDRKRDDRRRLMAGD